MRGAAVGAALVALVGGCPTPKPALRPVPSSLPASLPASAPTPTSQPTSQPHFRRPVCRLVGRQVVRFRTDDGVMLEGDFYPTGQGQGPVAVLVHMIPPRNNRSNYPASLIDALLLRGVNVLNLDRRGAGKSQGQAREAYRGPGGWLDIKAAQEFLVGYGCPLDAARWVCIGASNGTTSCLDAALKGAVRPRGLVFLSGGRYTEAQHPIAKHPAVRELPILFLYPSLERAWNARLARGAPPNWSFVEYKQGSRAQRALGHGTHIFRIRPEAVERVAGFVAQVLRK